MDEDVGSIVVDAPVSAPATPAYCSNLMNIPGHPGYDRGKMFYCRFTGKECVAYAIHPNGNNDSIKTYMLERAAQCPGFNYITENPLRIKIIKKAIGEYEKQIASHIFLEINAQLVPLERKFLCLRRKHSKKKRD